MKYVEVLICAALLSFMAGLIYQTERAPAAVEKPIKVEAPKSIIEEIVEDMPLEVGLKPCSKTTMMPCEVSPKDPVRDSLEDHSQKEGLFRKGENVTCIYQGVYWWTDGREDMKSVGMQCKVLEVTKELSEFEPGYQHIKVNCLKGLEKLWSDQPGVGMVRGHKLNFVERWFPSTDCYHFS